MLRYFCPRETTLVDQPSYLHFAEGGGNRTGGVDVHDPGTAQKAATDPRQPKPGKCSAQVTDKDQLACRQRHLFQNVNSTAIGQVVQKERTHYDVVARWKDGVRRRLAEKTLLQEARTRPLVVLPPQLPRH